MDSLAIFPLRASWSIDLHDGSQTTRVATWRDEQLHLAPAGTHFGYVYGGPSSIESTSGRFVLQSGMYFTVPGRCVIEGGTGLLITSHRYHGVFQLGGPIESRGRLQYIDGCTDSLLIPPLLLGDPCLNLLHLPTHIQQTRHTHPSVRVGVIVDGKGHCLTDDASMPLETAHLFIIPAHLPHCFHTDLSSLRIVAYHPDSDFGPTNENHPMLNRTIIASQHEFPDGDPMRITR